MSDLRDCVLVVDDEALIADLWATMLEDMGLEVCGTAATAEEAVQLAQTQRPKVVLMDVRLRGAMDGVDAAIAIHQSVGSKVIFITASKEPSTAARIDLDHPWGVLFKPVTERNFQATVSAAMQA